MSKNNKSANVNRLRELLQIVLDEVETECVCDEENPSHACLRCQIQKALGQPFTPDNY